MTIKAFTAASAAALSLAVALPARASDPELLVLDWAGFEVEGLYATYKDKHGDGPTYSLFGSDDEAFQKASSGFKADVGHPCSQMISKFREAGLIEPWDVSRIADFARIDPKFLNSPIFQDEGGVWFLPTDWGATAIAYNTDEVPAEDVATLQVFTDPKYQGRISLPNSSDDVWALAYLATGVGDWSAITDDQFAAAADWIRKAHANVRAYWADPAEMSQLMASGEVLIAWSWNDGVSILASEGFPVGYQREAKEGSSTWLCGYVNFKDQPGSEDKAYDFMNSWLRPDAAPALLDALGYGHSNLDGLAAIPADTLATAGLGPVSAPVFAQTPKDAALHERQLAEFEKIKAGF
jgi:spermidine/putrescine transport system substrate-binding protein